MPSSEGVSKRTNRTIGIATLMASTVLLTAAAQTQPSANSRVLQDGSYRCEMYILGQFFQLGDIVIRGRTYREPSAPANGPVYNYQMNDFGEITWLGPLGGFTSGGNSVSLSQMTTNEADNASFDIVMRDAAGAFTAATCTKQ
jgi:hypothetical protein